MSRMFTKLKRVKDRGGLLQDDNPVTYIKVKDGVLYDLMNHGQLVKYLRNTKIINSDGSRKNVVTIRCAEVRNIFETHLKNSKIYLYIIFMM